MDSQIEKIKAGLSIASAWAFLGLRGRPAKDCLSPFRDDSRASFSVYLEKGWQRWFDHGTAQGGDVVDLWARAKELSVKEAIDDILLSFPQLRVSRPSESFSKPDPEPVSPPEAPETIRWPHDLRTPAQDECRALGALRGLDPAAFFLASRLGTLKVATVYGQKSWIITDLNRRCAEARRFDGQPFTLRGRERKGFCLPGSLKDWPLGIKTANRALDEVRNILLVEGQPDYYAALQLAIDSLINFRPAAMLGAGIGISPECSHLFRGTRVVIIAHNDRSALGEKQAKAWATEIQVMGATDCVLQRLPIVCDDLNDFLLQRPGQGQQLLKGFHNGSSSGRTK
jgi:hypothetical protein